MQLKEEAKASNIANRCGRDTVHRDIRLACLAHFPDGFSGAKVAAASQPNDPAAKKQFRRSFASMAELQRRLGEVGGAGGVAGGVASLRRATTADQPMARKLTSGHISKKFQAASKISLELQKVDLLPWPEFLESVRATKLPLATLSDEKLTIYLTGDITLSSLELNYIRNVDKVKVLVSVSVGVIDI